MNHEILTLLAAIVAGGVASLSGFGIGSILTPLLATFMGTKLAVAVVSIPHFVGTALRFGLLRKHVDRRVLVTFGIASAISGLFGALFQIWLHSIILSYVLGILLVFAGMTGITGLAERMRFGRTTGWIAGILSGVFGGLVGNQGGIRSAALLGYAVSKESFVATATAIALLVDLFRMPVYDAIPGNHLCVVFPADCHSRSSGGYSRRQADTTKDTGENLPVHRILAHFRLGNMGVGASRRVDFLLCSQSDCVPLEIPRVPWLSDREYPKTRAAWPGPGDTHRRTPS
jgi:uncharacterized membrane protein YfcA